MASIVFPTVLRDTCVFSFKSDLLVVCVGVCDVEKEPSGMCVTQKMCQIRGRKPGRRLRASGVAALDDFVAFSSEFTAVWEKQIEHQIIDAGNANPDA